MKYLKPTFITALIITASIFIFSSEKFQYRKLASIGYDHRKVLDKEKVKEQILKELGPIVEKDKYPILQAHINEIFNSLSKSMVGLNTKLQKEELYPEKFLVSEIHNELLIVDSPLMNAFAATTFEDQEKRINKNIIVVTTGLIDSFYHQEEAKALDPKEFAKWESRLIGTLAHELAHPIDVMDPYGVESQSGGSQAIEVKTDFTGSEIARRSGFDHHSVLYAVDDIIKSENTDEMLNSIVKAKVSTHPQRDFRIATLALGGTLTSLNKGEVKKREYKDYSAKIAQELEQLKRKNHLSSIKSFSDGIERLNTILDNEPSKQLVEQVYVNFLNFLEDYKASNSEVSQLVGLNIRLKDVLNGQCDYAIIEKARSLSVFNSSYYKEQLNRFWPLNLDSESYSKFFQAMAVRSQFYPENKLVLETKKERDLVVIKEFSKDSEKIHKLKSSEITDVLNTISDKFSYERIIKSRGLSFRYYDLVLESLWSQFKNKNDFILAIYKSNEGIGSFFIRSLQDRLKGYVYLPDNARFSIASIKGIENKFAKFVHSEISSFGFREIVSNSSKRFDWHYLFRKLKKNIKSETLRLQKEVSNISIDKASSILKEIVLKDADPLRNALFHYTDKLMFTHKLNQIGWINKDISKSLMSLFDQETSNFHIVTRGIYYHNTDLYRVSFRDKFQEALVSFKPSSDKAIDELLPVIHDVLTETSGNHHFSPTVVLDIIANQIEKSNLDAKLKTRLLNDIFIEEKAKFKWSALGQNSKVGHVTETFEHQAFDSMDMGGGMGRPHHKMGGASRKVLKGEGAESWAKEKRYNTNRRVLNVLLRNVSSPKSKEDYLSLLNIYKKVGQDLENPNLYFDKLLKKLDKSLATKAIADDDLIVQFIETLMTLGKGDRLHSMLIPIIEKYDFSLEFKVRIYKKITPPGTIYSDKYFQRVILPYLDKGIKNAEVEVLKEAINFLKPRYESTSLLSEEIKVDLFKRLFDSNTSDGNLIAGYDLFMEGRQSFSNPFDITKEGLSEEDIDLLKKKSLIETLKTFLPEKSFAKDELVEEYVWKYKIHNLDLLKSFEQQKTSHINKAGAGLVSKGSAMSQYLRFLDDSQKWKVLDYILNPTSKMPRELVNIADQDIETMLGEFDETFKSGVQKNSTKEDKKLMFKSLLENKMSTLKQGEKILLINLLLSGGDTPLISNTESINKIMVNYLKLNNSDSAKYLRAQLKSINAPEVAPTLAYLLASNSGGSVELIEIFSLYKSVGVKTGQFAAIWKFFDDETNKKLEKLKDDAPKLSKFELTKRLHLSLPEEIVKEIKIKKILGSASIKTVVLIEYKGREVVMALKDPDAATQTQSNILRGKRFLKELEKEDIDFPRYFVSNFLDSMEESILDELNFDKEAEKIILQRDAYQQMNSIFSKELLINNDKWKLVAPDLVTDFGTHDDLIFQTKASGVSFHKIKDPIVRKKVGKLIVESALYEFFNLGLFDSDRHTGNYLIDEQNHIINIIDPGQSEYYSKSILENDERFNLFQFFRAIESKKPKSVIKGLKLMSKNSIDNLDLDELNKILNSSDKSTERLINIINYFAKQGGQLGKKYMFSLKGILTLAEDGYMDDVEFQKLFKNKVIKYLAKHPKSYLEPVFGDKCLKLLSSFLNK